MINTKKVDLQATDLFEELTDADLTSVVGGLSVSQTTQGLVSGAGLGLDGLGGAVTGVVVAIDSSFSQSRPLVSTVNPIVAQVPV